ncbi:MAG: gliding motility-associated C-terminal domain-containing protein [Flavobacteriaceae bacterium]|nr:gliding motility-associated C-terminal domain-containing protein [Flavobacteriaceae bacterium]
MKNIIPSSIKKVIFLVSVLLLSTNLFSIGFENKDKLESTSNDFLLIPIITTQPTDQTTCVGGKIELSVVASGTGTLSYVWKKGTTILANGGRISGADTDKITIDLAVGSDSGNYTCEVTDDDGPIATLTSSIAIVTVNPLPQLLSTITPAAICSGTPFSYTPSSDDSLATFSWSRASVAGISESSSSGPATPINEILTNSTSSPIQVTYKITITGALCTNTVDVKVLVNPQPTATISGGGNTCLNNTDKLIILTGDNGFSPYTFIYEIYDGTTTSNHTITTTSGNNISIPNSSNTVGTFNYNLLSVTDANSCTRNVAATASITVNAPPSFLINNPTITVCNGDTVDLTASNITSVPLLPYTYWNDAIATIPYATPNVATEGTYFIKGTNLLGCYSIKQIIIIKKQLPTVTVNSSIICSGALTTVTATANPPGAYDFSWTTTGIPSQGNYASFTTTVAGSYSVEITDQIAPNCKSLPVSGSVTVNPIPTATISGSTTVCINSTPLPVITFTGAGGKAPYTFTYTIGSVVNTVSSPSNSNVATITLPTNIVGLITVVLNSVQDDNSCLLTSIIGQEAKVTVNDLPNVNAGSDQVICLGEEVTLNGSGATNYSWDKSVVNGIPFKPTATGTITYTVTGEDINGCTNTDQVLVTVNPMPTAKIANLDLNLTLCKGSTEPVITFTGSNGVAPYTFTYSIGTITYPPLKTLGTNVSASINVPTNVAGVFNIRLISVEDSSTSKCVNSNNLLLPTTATVTVQESGLTPQTTTTFQTVCQDLPISPIVFNINGNATGAFVTGLPSGVSPILSTASSPPTLTITGSPTEFGIFNYIVTTTGIESGCNTTFTGTITVNQKSSIKLLSTGDEKQSICECSSIKNIVYQLEGNATSAVVTGLPSGLNWNILNKILTISGSTCVVGKHTFTISPLGICNTYTPPLTVSGEIEVIKKNDISTTGDLNPKICVNIPLATNIVFSTTSGGTLILNGNLPAGMNFNFNIATKTATISGTPTANGSFPYSVSTTNNCSTAISGIITVMNNQTITHAGGIIDQIACINSPLNPITFNTSLSVQNVTISPALPNGLSFFLEPSTGVVSIFGNPTQKTTGRIEYTITTIGICIGAPASTKFYLTIYDLPTITLEADSGSLDQIVCQSSPIKPIKFKINGIPAIAGGIDNTSLPSFITPSFDSVTGIYTLTGAPTGAGVINFQIKTLSPTACVASLNVIIDSKSSSIGITLNSAIGTDNQTVCQSIFVTTIKLIEYTLSGTSNVDILGLPAGISFQFINNKLSIFGTPTVIGTFNYDIIALPCNSIIKKGTIRVSSPIKVLETITQMSCNINGTIKGGKIEVNITGGFPTNNTYAINWVGPNGFRNNTTIIDDLLVSGNYTLTGNDAFNCPIPTTSYTIDSFVLPSVNVISIVDTDCVNLTGCANIEYKGGSGIYIAFKLEFYNPITELWELLPKSNYFNICGLKSGKYRLTVTDSKGCISAPFEFTVRDYSALSIKSITVDKNVCENKEGFISVEMSSLDTNLTFYYNNILVAHTYSGNNRYRVGIKPSGSTGQLKVINSKNCSAIKEISSTIGEPDFSFTSLNLVKYGVSAVNENILFTHTVDPLNIPREYKSIVWDFGDFSPSKTFLSSDIPNPPNPSKDSFLNVTHSYKNDGKYTITLTVYNEAGCSKSISYDIVVGEGASIMVPTAFSPNNDGVNDLFRPLFIGIKEISIYIYNNWGDNVFEFSAQVDDIVLDSWGWNGIEPKNTEPKNGDYRYYIQAITIDNKTINQEGRFVIIK